MKVTEIKPPKRVLEQFDTTMFLAGAIDMGEATDWQTKVVEHLESKATAGSNSIGIFNPRREDWDSSWTQDINNPQFFEQVSWELSHINNCDIAIVYFTKESKAPITLMELGKLSEIKAPENIIVFCPEGYHRKGNVDVLCYHKGIAVHTDTDTFYSALDRILGIVDNDVMAEGVEQDTFPLSDTDDCLEQSDDSIEIELFENTETVKLGDQNLLVVSEYDEIKNEDSCIMGNIKYKNKSFLAGICKEDGVAKTKLYYKRNGEHVSETFTIVRVNDEYPEEQLVITKN